MDIAADSRRIDIWCTYISDIGDDSLLSRYDALLSAQERARRARFRFARDQRRFLVTRALVRTALSRYASVRPEDWTFSTGRHGRPALRAPRITPALEFNISHSADLVMLGVTSGRTLGIDTESIAAREADIDGLDRYFAPEESAALLSLPAGERRRRFFELWTLKESYIKARGMGLAIPLDAFRFELAGERGLILRMRPELADSPDRWRLWQLTLRCDYLAAVCAAFSGDGNQDSESPRITVREVVPLSWERTVDVLPYRSTG
ncbi:MAG: 4'-phosphopantetheinyl transferase superfamily protein [Gammaproteobacteria bacterium]|nr:4'-phosphopantetheinyl transferase superfamily protein [Gammaproteobacteria bacterium]MDE2262032.1 4'-phosphopantetheinyl transferase superfamily protein [Gammaproteobacteria bacterium]